MKQPQPDSTSMLINFNKLDDQSKREAIKAIEEIANKYGGSVAQTRDYDSQWGGVTIYQP